MSNSNSNGGAAGKCHAPGVMCVVVGLKSPWITDNNGKVVTLHAFMLPGSSHICSCSPADAWTISDSRSFGPCWRVTGTGLKCSQIGATPYTTIPQRNLIPIGDGQLSLELLAEKVKEQQAQELAKAVDIITRKAKNLSW